MVNSGYIVDFEISTWNFIKPHKNCIFVKLDKKSSIEKMSDHMIFCGESIPSTRD